MMNSMLFEGPVLEEVLHEARLCFGSDVEIEAANRVRRGGVLGFFATEWYEVWARPSAAVVENPALALLTDGDDPDSFQQMVRNAIHDRTSHDDGGGPETLYESAMDQFFGGSDTGAPTRVPVPVGAGAPVAPDPAAGTGGAAPAAAPSTAETTRSATALMSEVVPATVGLEDAPRGESVFAPARAPRTELLWAMLDQLEAMPRSPELPDAGVVVFVGDARAALETARSIGTRSGRWNGDVAVLSRRQELDGVPSWLLIRDLDELATRVDRWRQRDGIVPVVVDHGVEAGDRAWATRALTATGADQVRLVAEAWRLPDDVGRMATKLGGVDTLELVEVSGSMEPLALLDLGIPVATVEGHACTPALLAAVWLENRRCV